MGLKVNHMKRTLIFGIALSAIALMATPPSVARNVVNVAITDYAYTPAVLNIPVGTTVVWANLGAAHHDVDSFLENGATEVPTEVTRDALAAPHVDGDLDGMGDCVGGPCTYSFTFTQPGVYMINCNEGGLHNEMKQVITVS